MVIMNCREIGLIGATMLLPTAALSQRAKHNSTALSLEASVNEIVRTQLSKHLSPGFSVGIAHRGAPVFMGAYGVANLEDKDSNPA